MSVSISTELSCNVIASRSRFQTHKHPKKKAIPNCVAMHIPTPTHTLFLHTQAHRQREAVFLVGGRPGRSQIRALHSYIQTPAGPSSSHHAINHTPTRGDCLGLDRATTTTTTDARAAATFPSRHPPDVRGVCGRRERCW